LFAVDSTARQLELLREMGVKEVALTLGANGCVVADAETRVAIVSPAVERVVDTSGAGDSFNGAYLAERLQGNTPVQAGEAGLLVASRVVSHAGAIVPALVSHPSRDGDARN
jgi:2-dehydro-3-deoxygluconokinase